MTPLKIFLATAAGIYVGLMAFCITMGLLEPLQHHTHRLKLRWQKFWDWLAEKITSVGKE